jgi:hypothetical protein
MHLVEHDAQHVVVLLHGREVEHLLTLRGVELGSCVDEGGELLAVQVAVGEELHEQRLAKDLVPVVHLLGVRG